MSAISNEPSAPRRVLHLVIEGIPEEKVAELSAPGPGTTEVVEVFSLTEANADEALEKIFAADAVAVWGKI
jgi:hypothetical protein